jgi:hypothetical protein
MGFACHEHIPQHSYQQVLEHKQKVRKTCPFDGCDWDDIVTWDPGVGGRTLHPETWNEIVLFCFVDKGWVVQKSISTIILALKSKDLTEGGNAKMI